MSKETPVLLCVEDVPELRSALRRMLKDEFKVETVATAEEAVAVLSNGHNIDIVLTDWQLEETTSEGVITLAECLHKPVVLHTSSDPEVMPPGHIILEKPCSAGKIKEALLYELDKSRSLVVKDTLGCPNCDGTMRDITGVAHRLSCTECGYGEDR